MPGFPIRTSSDPRSVDSSPRHNAASHVLHRLPVPRHPPCALKHLQHKKPEKNKKLHHNKPHDPCATRRPTHASMRLDARNHYPQIKHHTPPPRWSDTRLNPPTAVPSGRAPPPVSLTGRSGSGPVASQPNSVSDGPPTPAGPERPTTAEVLEFVIAPDPRPLQAGAIHRSPSTPNPHTVVGGTRSRGAP